MRAFKNIQIDCISIIGIGALARKLAGWRGALAVFGVNRRPWAMLSVSGDLMLIWLMTRSKGVALVFQ
jgi:hypothetical protein